MEIHIHIEKVYIGINDVIKSSEIEDKQLDSIIEDTINKMKIVDRDFQKPLNIKNPAAPLPINTGSAKKNNIISKKLKKGGSCEFRSDYFLAIEDIAKREKALFNKRWLLKKAGKLTNIIDSEISSMLDEIKAIKKKRQ